MVGLTVTVALFLAALLVGAVLAWGWSRWVLWSRRRRRVTVRLRDGGHFHGVLWGHDGSNLILKDAVALGVVDRGSVPLGEVLVSRHLIEYVQMDTE